jgi:hypothetical protein
MMAYPGSAFLGSAGLRLWAEQRTSLPSIVDFPEKEVTVTDGAAMFSRVDEKSR